MVYLKESTKGGKQADKRAFLTWSEYLGQIDASQFTCLVAFGEESHQTAPQYPRQKQSDNAVPTAVEPACIPRRRQNGNHRDGATGNIQQGGLLGRIPEALDESRRVCPTSACGNITRDNNDSDEPADPGWFPQIVAS